MAETIESLQLTLDPTSMTHSQFSDPLNSSNTLRLITDSYLIERGPRYSLYAQLRESKLQSKRLQLYEVEPLSVKKSVRFHEDLSNFEEDERVLAIQRQDVSKKLVKIHGMSSKFEENVQVSEIPKSEYSPPMKFHEKLGKFEENEGISATPKPNFLRKSVQFHSISNNFREILQDCEIPKSEYSPPVKKSVKFQANSGKKQGYSVLAQSVPDFSSTLRKENRKPTPESNNMIKIPRIQKSLTPPTTTSKREGMYGSMLKYGAGNKCVNSEEKQSNVKMMMKRKTYASIEELKGLSIAVNDAINGETRGGKKSNVLRKSTVFSRNYY